MQIDHLVLAAQDLDSAAALMDSEYGLTALAGGRHPGWGTANRIVPLGEAYLELAAVVDPAEAASSAFGAWVAAMAAAGTGMGWAVRTEHLVEVTTRLGLDIAAGRRTRPDGSVLEWLIAGVAEAAARPWLPFFIQWGPRTSLPGRAAAVHAVGTVGLSGIRVEGDASELDDWLGRVTLPVTVKPGNRGVVEAHLATPSGPISLSW